MSARAETPGPVTIYCSADEAIARPILAEFTKQTGIEVRPLFDTEAGKTTGLVHRLLAEKGRPRADVWWSSEIFGTIQLADAGVLAVYAPESARDIPSGFRDPGNKWTAFGLRGRVLAYNPEKTPKDKLPKTWADLARPEYRGRVALANPVFGTTRGHMAALNLLWGEESFKKYLAGLKENGVRIADGNSQSVMMVARGDVELGATDTDDVIAAAIRGDKIEMCFPAMDAPEGKSIPGTLWIPNSVAVVAGGPNAEGAKKLADYLVSGGVEMRLSMSESANLPVRRVSWDRFSDGVWNKRPSVEGGADGHERDAAIHWTDPQFARMVDSFKVASPMDYRAAAGRLRATDALVKETLLR